MKYLKIEAYNWCTSLMIAYFLTHKYLNPNYSHELKSLKIVVRKAIMSSKYCSNVVLVEIEKQATIHALKMAVRVRKFYI